jgi:hypothetical protein
MERDDKRHHHVSKETEKGFFILGLLSLAWLIIRTGRKPSRARYPCQQTAIFNGNLWIVTYILPIFSGLKMEKTGFLQGKKRIGIAAIIVVVSGAGAYWYLYRPGIVTVDRSTLENGLTLEAISAIDSPASDIFVVTKTTGDDGGVDKLIQLMASENLLLYESDRESSTQGPDGLISRDDVVLIKINCQWDERGGTNTDLLNALIQALLDHPDGFTGEIIISDNGQGEDRGSLSWGGSFTYPNNNAVDISQSVQDVVDGFSGEGRVSTYLWTDITETRAYEFSDGDMTDGYIVEEELLPRTGLMVSYAKFTTDYGTHVSFKNGIWNQNEGKYDSDSLKVINLSMLKSHTVYGATASVKNYMGVPSDLLTGEIAGRYLHTHSTISRGGMGALMVNTRYPVLNIIDSIWINPVPLKGPWTPYTVATQMNVITASTDPVALDYWSVKHILVQNWKNRSGEVSVSMDPDYTDEYNTNFFGNWLRLSMEEILLGGYDVNIDEANMNVFITENSSG